MRLHHDLRAEERQVHLRTVRPTPNATGNRRFTNSKRESAPWRRSSIAVRRLSGDEDLERVLDAEVGGMGRRVEDDKTGNWRRERDSNPRHGFPYSGFQDHRHRPLGHPSASKNSPEFARPFRQLKRNRAVCRRMCNWRGNIRHPQTERTTKAIVPSVRLLLLWSARLLRATEERYGRLACGHTRKRMAATNGSATLPPRPARAEISVSRRTGSSSPGR
jgi:hypothetical protein